MVRTAELPSIAGRWQGLAWLAAVLVTGYGSLDTIANWPADFAATLCVWFVLGGLAWWLTLGGVRWGGRITTADPANTARGPGSHGRASVRNAGIAIPGSGVVATAAPTVATDFARADWLALLALALLSLMVHAATGWSSLGLPPAYHDEFSYLFQAETLLAGRWSWPAPPVPETFTQFHVLSQPTLASRYYPGTGLWLLPWVWLGQPYLGQWLAGALSAALVYRIGWQLSGRLTGWFAGLLFAFAPGPALFDNLLLAHSPTLLGLLIFLTGFLAGWQQGSIRGWWWAGTGLAAAMLCRPATAAGFAAPFGIAVVVRTIAAAWQDRSSNRTASGPSLRDPIAPSAGVPLNPSWNGWLAWCGLGVPLLIGLAIMLSYNHAVTGDWWTSPYQLYTDRHTPRHVFGLNNVVRGEQRLGPEVLEDYDRWAENLTPARAWWNVFLRLLATATFTIDLGLFVPTLIVMSGVLFQSGRLWQLVAAAIVSQHALHWAYWYIGIFGWHYVYETTPLWCLWAGWIAARLVTGWQRTGQGLMLAWLGLLVSLVWAGMYLSVEPWWTARQRLALGTVRYPREKQAEFRQWIFPLIQSRPALVLVEAGSEGPQLDFVINPPGLSGPVLFGRYLPGRTDVAALAKAFPERTLYWCRFDGRQWRLLDRSPDER